MNILPPLNVIKLWRDEGLSPTEVYQRCEAFTSHKRPPKFKPCSLCSRKHYAKGFCKKHYYQWKYRESLKVKSLKIMSHNPPS